jgi:hypothetical protein
MSEQTILKYTMPKTKARCQTCNGNFGLIRHRRASKQFCSKQCLAGETRRRYHRSHERRDRDMSPKTMALATLIALVACDASAQAVGTQDRVPNLSGLYRCVRNCAGASLARITAYGWNLLLTNELGQTTKAWIDWPGHIWMPALNEGAVYSPDGFTIQFNRGSVWVLTDPQPLPGSARY